LLADLSVTAMSRHVFPADFDLTVGLLVQVTEGKPDANDAALRRGVVALAGLPSAESATALLAGLAHELVA
jgi:hypothetical protein